MIFEYMTNNNLDIAEFCLKCKITLNKFSDILKNDPNIDLIVLAKIKHCLQVKLIDMLE